MMIKSYNTEIYDSLKEALEDCGLHSYWNVISIYPTDGGKIRVIYYKDA